MSADQKCQAPPPPLKSDTRPSIRADRIDLPRLPGYFQVTVRSAIAASLSFGIAKYFGLDHPIFAAIAAVIATDLSPSRSRELGVVRLVATGIGAICGLMLCFVLPSGPLAIGFGILVAMLACQLFGAPDGAKVAGYISAIVILAEVDPWRYALLRCIETALGVGVAWLISYVPKLFPSREPVKEE
jgi:uncharacterized membrane protein YgaE (UPF0421/DUF939 family)